MCFFMHSTIVKLSINSHTNQIQPAWAGLNNCNTNINTQLTLNSVLNPCSKNALNLTSDILIIFAFIGIFFFIFIADIFILDLFNINHLLLQFSHLIRNSTIQNFSKLKWLVRSDLIFLLTFYFSPNNMTVCQILLLRTPLLRLKYGPSKLKKILRISHVLIFYCFSGTNRDIKKTFLDISL